jgi:hypothetical protein
MLAGAPQDRMRTNNQDATQVAIALFGDRPKLVFAASRILPRYKSNPGRKITARPECLRVSNDGRDGARTQNANAGLVLEVRKSEGHDAALATLGADPPTAAMLLGSPILVNPPHRFANAALRFKLPTVSFFKPIAKAGGLMRYGANLGAYYPHAVFMADAIVKGAKPGDVPAQRPDHYELVINLKTAKALGLELPPTLLAPADEVIE